MGNLIDLIVPYRKHSLIECHELIMKLGGLRNPSPVRKEAKGVYSIHKDWLERCLEEGQDLTEWETNFLTSLSDQIDRWDLSPRQAEILERIYTHKVK